jgi:DNA-binding NarL/FixJ family response regulator
MMRTVPPGLLLRHVCRPERYLGFSLPSAGLGVASIASVTISVFLVDDDAGFRRLAARLLSSFGLTVVGEAATVAEAVDAVPTLRPEAILVDVGLPDGDGCILAETLAAMSWEPRVVLTSSDPDAVSDADARRAGAYGFVPKGELPDGRTRQLLVGD